MLKDFLTSNTCFKLVCGAGNEDIEEVKKLVYIYSKAGCKFFDLSANLDIIKTTKQALELAHSKEHYLCVSVGIKDDPHVNKAVIDKTKCFECDHCIDICPQNAVSITNEVNEVRCVGCGKCKRECPASAISFVSREKDLKEVLPPIIKEGIDCIEFHAFGLDETETKSKWAYINSVFSGILSICTSRGKLSDENMIARIKNMLQGRESYSTIIQADGFPMSGSEDGFKTTLQAVATAQLVSRENLEVFLILSGGTNTKTSSLAKMCELNYNGIAVGSFARKIVKKYTTDNDFWNNIELQEEAIAVAKNLVDSI